VIKINRALVFVLSLLLTTAVQAASTVHKPADVGPYWSPLGNQNATDVYANSFIAPESGAPTALGTYLMVDSANVPNLRFEIWGDNAGPDPTNVIASTGSLALPVDGNLNCFSARVTTLNGSLVQDQVYWFAATGVGEAGAPGSYQTGGHTQNSVYADNGTFWYSNDPAGITFDGQNLTPEMAFEVQIEGGAGTECLGLPMTPPVPALPNGGKFVLILLAALSGMVFVRTRFV
jgi:hypothetical protein